MDSRIKVLLSFILRNILSRMSRHGIMSPFAKGLTTAQSPNRQQSSAQHSKPFDRFKGILRTSGSEPATGRREHRNAALIKPD